MGNHHSGGGVGFVPTRLLAVLYHIEFVGVGVVVYDVGAAMLADGLDAVDVGVLVGQHYRLLPSAHHLLVGRVAYRSETVAGMAASAHQVEVVHAEGSSVDDVVEVGES